MIHLKSKLDCVEKLKKIGFCKHFLECLIVASLMEFSITIDSGSLTVFLSTPDVSESLQRSTDLNSVLTPECSRQAVVTRVRTVTTGQNSLVQPRCPDTAGLPVTMGDKADTLWPQELER